MKRLLSVFLTAVLLCGVLSACSLFGMAQPQNFSLDKSELSMVVGDSVDLSAGEATKVNWESSDDSIATVQGGTVNAKSAGSAVITASLESGAKATCNVTVTDRLITEIKLNVSSTRVDAGKTIQLTATYSPSNASDTTLKWSSSDESVAIVNSEGYVTAVKDGVANIKCTSSNGTEAACTVTVGGSAEAKTSEEKKAAEAPATEAPKTNQNNQNNQNNQGNISYSSGFIFPDSSARKLSDTEVRSTLYYMSGYSPSGSYVQDAINEIYARNGYIFKTESIKSYYESYGWYTPNPSFSTANLSEVEQYNIALFEKYE